MAFYNMACCISVAADGPAAVINDILGPKAHSSNPGPTSRFRRFFGSVERLNLMNAAVKYLRMVSRQAGQLPAIEEPRPETSRASHHQQFVLMYQQFVANYQQVQAARLALPSWQRDL